MPIKVKSKIFKKYNGFVYDLEVDKDHNYIIEDCIVHNSSAGSLICYLLGITNVDSIKYGLLFSRFIDLERCFVGDTKIILNSRIEDIKGAKIGDTVINKFGEEDKIINVRKFNVKEKLLKIHYGGKVLTCTKDHKWLVYNEKENKFFEKQAKDLKIREDKLIKIFD